jgi:hypothetical protein
VTEHSANDFPVILTNLRRIQKAEGRVDDDWRTATGLELDRLAARYDLNRKAYETDDSIRKKIGAVVQERRSPGDWPY